MGRLQLHFPSLSCFFFLPQSHPGSCRTQCLICGVLQRVTHICRHQGNDVAHVDTNISQNPSFRLRDRSSSGGESGGGAIHSVGGLMRAHQQRCVRKVKKKKMKGER